MWTILKFAIKKKNKEFAIIAILKVQMKVLSKYHFSDAPISEKKN